MLSKWRLPFVLLIILVYLQYSLWFGKNNIINYFQTKDVVAQFTRDNQKLKMPNDAMFAEVADLYSGSDAIEERARNSLGMIKSDEHFFRIINENTE